MSSRSALTGEPVRLLTYQPVRTDIGRVRQVLCPVLVGRDEEVRYLQGALAAVLVDPGWLEAIAAILRCAWWRWTSPACPRRVAHRRGRRAGRYRRPARGHPRCAHPGRVPGRAILALRRHGTGRPRGSDCLRGRQPLDDLYDDAEPSGPGTELRSVFSAGIMGRVGPDDRRSVERS